MKYVFKTDLGYYKFSRKIPNSKKLFSFSLKTQNLKVAKKITNSFLLKSHDYFLFIQDLTKEDVVNQFNEIVAALNEYKKAALVEYSKLEQDRHTHFTYEGADGSHPEAIKYWLSEMQEHISARKTERQTLEFGRRILSRATTELKTFYGNITKEQKLFFLQTLIKTEAKLLQVDNKRANDYFGADYMLQQQAPTDSVGGGIEEVLKKVLDERLGTKTIQFISKEDVVQKFKESAPVVKRYKRESYMFDHSLNILLSCSAKESLNDYDNEDYEYFFQAFLFFPAGITKKSVFSKTFESDYVKISKY